MGERIASLEQWAKDHDTRCSERIKDIKSTIGRWEKIMIALVASLVVWGASQIYDTLRHQPPVVQALPVAAGP